MKRWIHASTTESAKYTKSFFNKRYDREGALLDWISDEFYEENDIDLSNEEDYERALEYAEEVAEGDGWQAFDTVGKEFEALWDWNDGDVEQILAGFDYAYGNGERMYPLDWGNGAQEAFYYWVKLYHPEADLSGIDLEDLN